jgi:hypothetical protein
MAQRVALPINDPDSPFTTEERKLPPEVETELRALEVLNDDVLWAVARSRMSLSKQRRWRRLLEQSQQGRLAESEQQELARLMADNDRLTVCKAQAYLILKQRGNRIPELDKLQPGGRGDRMCPPACDGWWPSKPGIGAATASHQRS